MPAGDVFFAMGRYDAAKACYKRVLQDAPKNQMLLLALGDLHNDTKEYEIAERFITKAYKIDPSFLARMGKWTFT